jgi:hypothetical protein
VKKWIRFDEHEDVLASTDLLAMLIPKLKTQPALWKWVIIAAHSGVQGALVCSLRDTTGTNVLSSNSAKAMLDWLASPQGNAPREHVASFSDLLKKYRKKYPHLRLSDGQLAQLRKLDEHLRNNFIHFVPKGWSIEAAGLPALIRCAANLIDTAMGQDRVSLHLTCNMKRRLQKNLEAIQETSKTMGSL